MVIGVLRVSYWSKLLSETVSKAQTLVGKMRRWQRVNGCSTTSTRGAVESDGANPGGSRQSNGVRRGGRSRVPSNRNKRRFTFPQALFSPDEERPAGGRRAEVQPGAVARAAHAPLSDEEHFADETPAAAQAADVVLAVHELQSPDEGQAVPLSGQRPYSRLSGSLRCSRPLYSHSCGLPRPCSAQLCSHLPGLQPHCSPPLCSHSCELPRPYSAQLCTVLPPA